MSKNEQDTSDKSSSGDKDTDHNSFNKEDNHRISFDLPTINRITHMYAYEEYKALSELIVSHPDKLDLTNRKTECLGVLPIPIQKFLGFRNDDQSRLHVSSTVKGSRLSFALNILHKENPILNRAITIDIDDTIERKDIDVGFSTSSPDAPQELSDVQKECEQMLNPLGDVSDFQEVQFYLHIDTAMKLQIYTKLTLALNVIGDESY